MPLPRSGAVGAAPRPTPWLHRQLGRSCGLGPGWLQDSAPCAVLVISLPQNVQDFTSSPRAWFGLPTFLPAHAAALEVPSPANTNHNFPLPLQPGWLHLFLEGKLIVLYSGGDFGREIVLMWILFGTCSAAQARPESILRKGPYWLGCAGPRGPPKPLQSWSSNNNPTPTPHMPRSANKHVSGPSPDSILPGATDGNWDWDKWLWCGKECGRTYIWNRVTKPHSSAGLIVGFAHSLLIASSVTADLDGLRIKARPDLQREVIPFTASAQLTWLRQPATFQAREPRFGLFSRGEINSWPHKLMPLQLLCLSPVCCFFFPTELVSLLGHTRSEMQDCSHPALAL